MSDDSGSAVTATPVDFIRAIIDEDLAAGRHHGRVATRFPPEPNGYLHIGHAKSICLNFGVARERGGSCNLRFDDTNPVKEDIEYVDSIKEDVAWLGFTWDAELYASDYFERLYQFAVALIKQGKAYLDSLSAEEVRYGSTLTEPGTNSPCAIDRWPRTRSVRADAGDEFQTAHVLRARSTWRRRTSTCATRRSTGSATPATIGPATPGASTRCTTTRIRCRTRSSGSRTRSARSSTRIIARSTTGWSAA
jgi:glutaminyl-tRNA synthetase